jgi:hypothetical protein
MKTKEVLSTRSRWCVPVLLLLTCTIVPRVRISAVTSRCILYYYHGANHSIKLYYHYVDLWLCSFVAALTYHDATWQALLLLTFTKSAQSENNNVPRPHTVGQKVVDCGASLRLKCRECGCEEPLYLLMCLDLRKGVEGGGGGGRGGRVEVVCVNDQHVCVCLVCWRACTCACIQLT